MQKCRVRLKHKRGAAILHRIKRGYGNSGIAVKPLQEPETGHLEPF
jgi:hypothetical protein